MSSIFRNLLFFRNLFNRQKPAPGNYTEEKWIADFSKPKHARFNIKSESSYDANLQKNQFYSGHSLVLGLKKPGCLVWVEAPDMRCRDMVISGTVRIDAKGGYAAGGVHFRLLDDGTYYSFLVSSKEYFRLDVVRNGMPFPLIGWTELPLFSGETLKPDQRVDFSIIFFGSNIIVLARGRWAAEVKDSSILEGTFGFSAASYEAAASNEASSSYDAVYEDAYTAEVFLEALTVDSRIAEVSRQFDNWQDSVEIDSKARLNLAETFAAIDQPHAALAQLHKCWNIPGYNKNQSELLLAGRIALSLNLPLEAEKYIGSCYEIGLESQEGLEAMTEMAILLYQGQRYAELKKFCKEALKVKPDDPVLLNLQGHSYWNSEKYKNAASSYDKAFGLGRNNGIFAKNAAAAYEAMEKKDKALERYLDAGRVFLNAGDYDDLGLIMPKLLSLGEDNWEARNLAGKWAFAIENWKLAKKEFSKSEKLRKAMSPVPSQDGAQVFLEALLQIREGKRKEALSLLKKAVSLEKDFALFHFRLAENLYILNDDSRDPKMLEAMNTALSLSEKENAVADLYGLINRFAAQINLKNGDLVAAAEHLQKAMTVLKDDPEGILANCAGNMLFLYGSYEEAEKKYIEAMAADPDNAEYLCNRARCLIEQGFFGEAEELITRSQFADTNPDVLELISNVSLKKGEYPRAEEACRLALKIDPHHAPSLLSLGWIHYNHSRHEETAEILSRLENLELDEDISTGKDDLRFRLMDKYYERINCASCKRYWDVLKNPPPVPSVRLYAEPPDDLPAGTCPECEKTFCIGCAKNNLDRSGRFICVTCNKPLKLINNGLKKIVASWKARNQ